MLDCYTIYVYTQGVNKNHEQEDTMTDTKKLMDKIQEKNFKTSEIIAALGTSHQTFYNRIKSRDFKVSEVAIITDTLGLTDDERDDIFFS